MAIPDPPDRGYDEHQARKALDALIGSELRAIRVVTLDELRTSDDGRQIEADLAIELALTKLGTATVALFAWGVNFGVEQLCVWHHALNVVWPAHADSPSYDLPTTWPGWPRGALRRAEVSKLRAEEVGINQAGLHFEEGGFRVKTGGLSGDEPDALLLSPID